MTFIKKTSNEPAKYPLLPMRDMVVFPQMTIPFFIGRRQSLEALELALSGNRKIFVTAQKNSTIETPTKDDLYSIGTIGNILQIMRLPNGTIKALFEAKQRGKIISTNMLNKAYTAMVETIEVETYHDIDVSVLINSVKSEFINYLRRLSKNFDNIQSIAQAGEEPGELADLIAPLLSLDIHKKQDILEITNGKKRLEKVYAHMLGEGENKKVEKKLKNHFQVQVGRTHKDYYLNEQMKAIQKELGGEEVKVESNEYAEKIEQAGMTKEAKEVALKELKKLKMMPAMSSEANIVRNYLDYLLQVPWKKKTKDNYDLQHAQTILDEDHYGLDQIKERIIEYLAVAKMSGALKGPIICLVGPPGVGKTSLAKSVARALGRKYVRMSFGGIRDEAEIRGHRRTYLGALPGKIIQGMKKAKTTNPLILLDEIDKMTHSQMGDPAAALLEVLDPEQNVTFMDHYLEVEYNLSKVLFFCTANSITDIPLPLKDRMEVIQLSGYTELEKEQISEKYLIPKQIKENGLKKSMIQFHKASILSIIRKYTKEAGVRGLERNISKVCRKTVTELIKNENINSITITKKKVEKYLGVPLYRYGKIEEKNEIGTVTGLAWTSVGGELLTLEVSTMKGTGKIQLTGKLGDVMKESAQAAISFVRSNANHLGIYSKIFQTIDIHVHLPEGAIPKDGPSAGVGMITGIVSAFTSIPVRKETAMTGEITLRGKVLPIGGLKEKLLAAKRGMLERVIIPHENEKELKDIPKEITQSLEIIQVKTVQEVLEASLERMPVPVDDQDLKEEEKKYVTIDSSLQEPPISTS